MSKRRCKYGKDYCQLRGRLCARPCTAAQVANFKSLAEQNGSDVVVEEWGNRKLAYPINYKTEGYYVLMTFVSGPAFPRELDRKLRIAEGVMRSLIVCKGE